MKIVDENKCPECGSKDVYDTGSRAPTEAQGLLRGRSYKMPENSIMQCKKCGCRFILKK